MNILILGANGMLGQKLFKRLSQDEKLNVWGTIRDKNLESFFANHLKPKLISDIDCSESLDKLNNVIKTIKPDILINCIGITKKNSSERLRTNLIKINALLPHKLLEICNLENCRLIHISTDCVFSGKKGNYSEVDPPDPIDLYGMSKLLGEFSNHKHLTIRTSLIGFEFQTKRGLLEWFLSRKKECFGYSNAFFSGLTTLELSKVIESYILKTSDIHGLYNIASPIISKADLLSILAKVFKKKIIIKKINEPKINRSLDQSRFYNVTGYKCTNWMNLITEMYDEEYEQAH